MNKENFIKIAAAAVAAYLLYQFAKSRGWIGAGLPPTTAPPTPIPAAAPVATTPTQQQQQGGAVAAMQQVAAAQNSDPIMAARDSSYAASSQLQFTPDEWNYYRGLSNLAIRDALEYPGVTPENRGSFKISGTQYHTWVSGGTGIGSVRIAGGLGAYDPWGLQ